MLCSVVSPPLRLDRVGNWLCQVRRVPTPNQDSRPPGAEIDLVVVHGISVPAQQFGGCGIEQLFTNTLNPAAHVEYAALALMRVSAHLLIRREGDMIQFAPFYARTWHAGASLFGERAHCNDFSIGIELEGTDHIPYTDAQYIALGSVLRVLGERWPLLRQAAHIVGHCDIAAGRKTDPGAAFDWSRLRGGLTAPQLTAQ